MEKTKALISCAETAQLISVFVFAYANCWFSHAKAHNIISIPREDEMRPASYLPLLYEVVLLASFSTLILGAGLFPWGTHNGDTVVWESDDSNDGYTLTPERPFNFNGVMRDEITVRIFKTNVY